MPVDEKHPEVADDGKPEVILVYELVIPSERQEPELYSIPHRERIEGPQELWLRYPLATVMLLSQKADDKFRQQNPHIVGLAEALYVGE